MVGPRYEKPRLIIDTEILDPEAFNFISALEKDIYKQPETFLRALGALSVHDDNGKKTIEDTWQKEDPAKTADDKVTSAEELIQNYLANNYGKAVELNDDGEDTLAADETYPLLIDAIHSQRGERADTAKAQLARQTLHVFARQVLAWQSEHSVKPMPLPLPEAS